jgi:hypothetical protein
LIAERSSQPLPSRLEALLKAACPEFRTALGIASAERPAVGPALHIENMLDMLEAAITYRCPSRR